MIFFDSSMHANEVSAISRGRQYNDREQANKVGIRTVYSFDPPARLHESYLVAKSAARRAALSAADITESVD
jgi:hypothetical protein